MKTALLVIDMQNDFVLPGAPASCAEVADANIRDMENVGIPCLSFAKFRKETP